MAKRRKLYLLITAAALFLLALTAWVLLSENGERQRQEYLQRARESYAEGDYETALRSLRRADSTGEDPECLMLMADCYEAAGNYMRAIEALRKLNTADSAIASRIRSIEEKRDLQSRAAVVTIAGLEFERGAREANLDGCGITDEQMKEISSLYALDSLSLRDNQITDISLLARLGGLDILDLAGNSIREISALSGLRELRILDLSGNPIADFSPLYSLSSLNTLTVTDCGLEDAGLLELAEALPSCTVRCTRDDVEEILLGAIHIQSDARELDLSGMGIRDISALAGCRELVSLDLSDNSISDLTPLMGLPKLQRLDISGNDVSDLRPLIGLPLLLELNAENNLIHETSAAGSMAQLNVLDLSGNAVSDFSGLGKLGKLWKLELRDTGITDADLMELSGLIGLQILDVQDNQGLSNRTVSALKSVLTGCTVLCSELVYEVDFCGHTVRSDERVLLFPANGITSVTGLENMTSLEELDLHGNEISELYTFEMTPSRDSLLRLNLADNQIDSVLYLSRLSQVEELDLSGNRINEVGVLQRLTTLRVLNLSGNPVTEDQIAELRAALPYCDIRF